MQTDRLTTLDEYGGRRFVIPAEVTGPLRTWRNRLNFFLVILFVALPWIKINGLQAVLLDIPNRHFEIFGQLFMADDSPLIFLVLGLVALLLAFVTAVWGRVWCGWACPQTVFIDGLYRKIEIWVEGDYLKRRRLKNSGFSWSRFHKSCHKWLLFFIVSSVIAHSVIAYFAGSTRLLKMIQGSPQENWTYFLIVSLITTLLLFNFGWFREQFCTIMCPYGRFQSVLMDDDSVTVLYDEVRGEPRKGTELESGKRGDCVSCNRCVEVCPAAIDIRKGIQMECIACTACIDACNVIMKRLNKPPDLIRYQSVTGKGVRIWRPRVMVYIALTILLSLTLGFLFLAHKPYSLTLLRGKDSPYQILPDGSVLNHLKVHLFNQSQADQQFSINPSANLVALGIKVTQAQEIVSVPAGREVEVHLFATIPRKLFDNRGTVPLEFLVNESITRTSETKEFLGVGP